MIDEAMIDSVSELRGLNESARRELARHGVLRRFAPGEVLWRKGSDPRGLFVVIEGEVRVVRGSRGRQHVIHVEGPGGTLGEVPLFAGGRYPATAVATRRTICLTLGREALLKAIQADPELAFALVARLARRVGELVERLDRRTVWSVRARLAAHLLDRARVSSVSTFTLGRSQAEVAEELGTVREVLARGLREFRKDGLVRSVGRGRFEILDKTRLEEAAES